MSQTSPPVVAAVRERQAKLRDLLAEQMETAKRHRQIAEASQQVADTTRAELDELAVWLQMNAPAIAENVQTPAPTAPLFESKASASSTPLLLRRNAVKDAVRAVALQLGEAAPWFQSEEVVSALAAKNLVLDVQHPVVRASQVLTLDSRFEHVRGYGWRLKKRTPAVTGVHGATQSVPDTERKEGQ